MLVAMRAYEIVTGDKDFPQGNGTAGCSQQKCHQRANNTITE